MLAENGQSCSNARDGRIHHSHDTHRTMHVVLKRAPNPCKLQAVITHNTSTHNQEYYICTTDRARTSGTTREQNHHREEEEEDEAEQPDPRGHSSIKWKFSANVPNPPLHLLSASAQLACVVYSVYYCTVLTPLARFLCGYIYTCPRRRYFLLARYSLV